MAVPTTAEASPNMHGLDDGRSLADQYIGSVSWNLVNVTLPDQDAIDGKDEECNERLRQVRGKGSSSSRPQGCRVAASF